MTDDRLHKGQTISSIPECDAIIENNTNEITQAKVPIETKKNRKEIYGKNTEAKVIKEEISDFNFTESTAYKHIIGKFGKSIKFVELLGIINAIDLFLKNTKNIALPLLSRNEKRSFPLLIKYIERNIDLILPYIQYMSLCDSDFRKMPLDVN